MRSTTFEPRHGDADPYFQRRYSINFASLMFIILLVLPASLVGQSVDVKRPRKKLVEKYYTVTTPDSGGILSENELVRARNINVKLLRKLKRQAVPELNAIASQFWYGTRVVYDSTSTRACLKAQVDSANILLKLTSESDNYKLVLDRWHIIPENIERIREHAESRLRSDAFNELVDQGVVDRKARLEAYVDTAQAKIAQRQLATLASRVEYRKNIADMLDAIGNCYWFSACTMDSVSITKAKEYAEAVYAGLTEKERRVLKSEPYRTQTAAFFADRARSGQGGHSDAPGVDLQKVRRLPERERHELLEDIGQLMGKEADDFLKDLQEYWNISPCTEEEEAVKERRQSLEARTGDSSLVAIHGLSDPQLRQSIWDLGVADCPKKPITLVPGVPIPYEELLVFVDSGQYSFLDRRREAPVVFIENPQAMKFKEVMKLYQLGDNPSLERYLLQKLIAFNERHNADDAEWVHDFPKSAKLSTNVGVSYVRVPTLEVLGFRWIEPKSNGSYNPIAAYRK